VRVKRIHYRARATVSASVLDERCKTSCRDIRAGDILDPREPSSGGALTSPDSHAVRKDARMAEQAEPDQGAVELLQPFYLDTEMSMAFAAALAGGVALEREEVESETQESQAVRNLRGNLRLFGALGASGGRETAASEAATAGSRLVRQHTEASIFIALYDELRRTGRIKFEEDISNVKPRDLVALDIGPAVAPLRRVVDQIVRLIDVAAPMVGAGEDSPLADAGQLTRQQRRERARQMAKALAANANEDVAELARLRSLFVALQDDLDRSGMIDVVVRREDAPSIVLTLDKRLTSEQTLELLHTSRFTVIGKVTEVWTQEDDFVNLYRRSVMSLVPALGQTVTWGMFLMIAAIASSAEPEKAEEAARAAVGLGTSNEPEEGTTSGQPSPGEANSNDTADGDDIVLGADVAALNPGVNGPAIQVLPLAICA